jgi:transmembrane sensor
MTDPSTLRETAALWHERLHRNEVSERTQAEFERWLAESPSHCGAYDDIDRVWLGLKNSAADPRILALRHETALRLTRHTSRHVRALVWRVAAVILLALAATVMLGVGPDMFRKHSETRYATATGERLSVTLNDGSQLTLNTQTDLAVAFTRAERTVHLARGQAFFEVAKDASRPFVVEARQRRLVAVGTAFDVRLDGQKIDVTMVEGTVRVEKTDTPRPPRGDGAPARRTTGATTPPARDRPVHARTSAATIVAGEQLTVEPESLDRVRAADLARATSWRHGQVIFENTRLADAIAEINRYSDRKIELADATLADLRLSGGFATSRPALFVEAVTSYFPVEIKHADASSVVLDVRSE